VSETEAENISPAGLLSAATGAKIVETTSRIPHTVAECCRLKSIYTAQCGETRQFRRVVSVGRCELGVTIIKFGLNALVFVLGWRSDNFIVGLTDVSPTITAPTLWNYDVCAQYPGAVGDGATVNLTCRSCMPARRYLIVQVEDPVITLNFCEIEVYARAGNLVAVTLRSSQSNI